MKEGTISEISLVSLLQVLQGQVTWNERMAQQCTDKGSVYMNILLTKFNYVEHIELPRWWSWMAFCDRL